MRFAVFSLLFCLFTTVVVTVIAVPAGAQIDPSSAMLLNSNPSNAPRDGGLDTGRYTVRPRDLKTRHPRATPTPVPVSDDDDASPSGSTASQPATQSPAVITTPTATPAPALTGTKPGPQAPNGPQFVPDEEDEIPPPPRDERRFTMLELSFAPGYLYNESRSTFAPRNYFVSAPSAGVDASVWTTPGFGVHTGFNGTLNANVADSLDNTRNASVAEQWFTAGLRARTFFGDTPSAPTVTYGLDYREFEFRVPSDSTLRNKLGTSGLTLLIDAEIPTSSFGAWQFGVEFGPKLSHTETSNALNFRTGDSVTTTAVGAHLGARYRFNRTQGLFWRVSYSVEKNQFNGATSINDPLTGLPQTNVGVTNAFTLFQLGLTWAD